MTAPLDLAALRAKAEAATPGLYIAERDDGSNWLTIYAESTAGYEVASLLDREDAAYFAALPPSVALLLIDVAEKAREYRHALTAFEAAEVAWMQFSVRSDSDARDNALERAYQQAADRADVALKAFDLALSALAGRAT